jgi:3-ketosteroid 9alpha-monooxygenase subunit B
VEYFELEIARVVQETSDARSFVLEVPEALRERFAYRAGQFLTFRVPWEGAPLIRCYSLSSSPDVDREVQVTVKRVADGRVSNFFHDRLHAGDRLEVLPPSGRFVLHEGGAPLVLFAGGSGITPVLSLVKSALATTARRVRLFYANRDADSIIFRRQLDELARRHPGRLSVVHHLDAEAGFADAALVARQLEGFEGAHCYLCGPGPFMALVEETLRARGVEKERIFIERFVSFPDGEALRIELSAEAEAPSELIVHLGGRTHRIPYEKGQSILRAVLAAGLEPPFACEEGYCGSCAAHRLQGEVVMAVNDVFDADELEEGWVLTCQGRPVSPVCEIRYDD